LVVQDPANCSSARTRLATPSRFACIAGSAASCNNDQALAM